MSATGVVSARARRHPMTVITRARTLASEGCSPDTIVWVLQREGVTVGISSVKRWTNPKASRAARRDDERRAAARALKHGSKGMSDGRERPEFKLARMRALREVVGLKDAQIARVMQFDFGEPITRGMVRYALLTDRYPRTLR